MRKAQVAGHGAVPPAVLVDNISRAWGDEGRRWLTALPRLLDELAEAWGLVLGPPFPLSFNWVCPAVRADGSAAVLKVGVPGSAVLDREAAALAAYGGNGAVRLLDRDRTRGGLLVERCIPGTRVRDLVIDHDVRATAVIVDVLNRLHRAPVPAAPSVLPELVGYRTAFAAHRRRDPQGTGLPRRWVDAADRLFADLCADPPRRAVLHGDAHHDNVLAAGDGWSAIDPHGVVGDPGFEIAAVLYNPDPERLDEDLLDLVPARVEQLADGLGLPVERARAWGFAGCLLSAVWTAEDGSGAPGSRALAVAALLAPAVLGAD